MTIEAPGFKKSVQTALKLDVNQRRTVDVVLEAGNIAEVVTVAADQVAVFQALGGGWEDAPKVVPPAIAGVTPKIRDRP